MEQLVDGDGQPLSGLLDLALEGRHLLGHPRRLPTSLLGMDRLSPGDTAPDFTLPDDRGSEVSLASLRGRKVIVYFYPAAMTP
ncbi:MAG TPA: redoxin domain-containing protein, partial [Acidimicrobiales bacterium]|nr:redoxin domain-containing protein [Acidimicrobiales bacterium]